MTGMDKETSGPRTKADPLQWRGRVYRSLVGVLLVFIAARSVALWWQYDQVLLAEQGRAENLAHVLAEHLERTFGPIESALNQLAVYSDRIGGPQAPREAWAPVMAATLSGLSGIGSLNVIDADGIIKLSTNPAVTGASRREGYLYRRLKDDPSAGLIVAPAVPSATFAGVTIPVGRALRDQQGRFNGLLAATFQPDRLRSFYSTIDVGPRGVIQLIHPDGFLLFRQPPAGHSAGEPIADRAILNARRNGSSGGVLRAPIDVGGAQYLTAWRNLSRSSALVAVSIARWDALASWRTELGIVLGVAIGMGLMLAVAGFWITASSRAHAHTMAERDQVDAALRTSQAQFQAIMDHTPVFVFVKDLDGRYTFINRAAERWTAERSKPDLGMTPQDFLSERAAKDVISADRTVIATKAPAQRELIMETPRGRRTLVSVKFPMIDATGAVSGVGTIVTDITDQKHAEIQLAQAQRMEAIGQLTGGIAHDFNNMLTAILLNAEVLATQIQNESLRQLAEAMRLAAEHGADLTARLLAFGRRQTLVPQPTDVNALLRDMAPLMQRTLGEHIEIKLVRGENLWPATIDRSQLESAVLNLAVNARDAMLDGGRLTIETTNAELDEGYAAMNPDVRPGQYVMVAVSDTGAGMSSEIMARAFEPFFTTEDVGKGTGLGLSMVYGFVKQSEGHARIYSEVGVGTVVRLYLPRSKEVVTAVPSPAPAQVALPTGTETILLVEDDSLVRAYAATQLGALGYKVVTAENARQAIEAIERGCAPDLLFTDMIMPGGMNGRELAEQLLARRPGLKVLYTSGYAHGAIEGPLQGQHQGGHPVRHLLGKPYRRRDLATKVREVLDEPAQAA
jgi:PAS domain S-box-containing protein